MATYLDRTRPITNTGQRGDLCAAPVKPLSGALNRALDINMQAPALASNSLTAAGATLPRFTPPLYPPANLAAQSHGYTNAHAQFSQQFERRATQQYMPKDTVSIVFHYMYVNAKAKIQFIPVHSINNREQYDWERGIPNDDDQGDAEMDMAPSQFIDHIINKTRITSSNLVYRFRSQSSTRTMRLHEGSIIGEEEPQASGKNKCVNTNSSPPKMGALPDALRMQGRGNTKPYQDALDVSVVPCTVQILALRDIPNLCANGNLLYTTEVAIPAALQVNFNKNVGGKLKGSFKTCHRGQLVSLSTMGKATEFPWDMPLAIK
ncbi:hypothetical protein M422DRAFT_242634 [Sphaerobolus stellatus SS14]|nr:hypothetical protein M422DRAFT_242634 [Sphaerobolus stellatus SS14]